MDATDATTAAVPTVRLRSPATVFFTVLQITVMFAPTEYARLPPMCST
jgi:hypothetical protein